MDPRTIDRSLSPRGATLALRLSVVTLGLLALTGCAWTVLAGHAWLSLLSGCSRWLVSGAPRSASPAAPSTPIDQPQPAEPQAPLPAPVTLARAGKADPGPDSSLKVASAPAAIPDPGAWPEALEYAGATCAGVFVYAVTLNERAPRWSAVSLATSSSGRAKYARPGQRVEDWEVLGITDDWTGANPVVWLARDEQVCRATLTGNPARVQAVQREARQREAQLQEEARRRREERRRRRARRRR